MAPGARGARGPSVGGGGGRLALASHDLDALLQLADLVTDDAPVGFELRLAGAPGPDAAAGAREVRPQPRQAGQLVLELGQLDLEAPLVGLSVLGEDVEDEAATIEHLDLQQLLERLLLVRLQFVVGDEQREARLALGLHELLGLALADQPGSSPVSTATRKARSWGGASSIMEVVGMDLA